MSAPIVVTTQSFQTDVIENPLPVLVDFWADWCEPCKMLAPVLDTLAADYTGRVVIAKVNVDEENQAAAAAGIRSLPTLMLFVGGQPVEQIVGVQPEANIRAILDKHAGAATEEPQAPLAPDADGNPDVAIAKLQSLLADDPGNVDAIAAMARIHVMNGELETARALLEPLGEEEHGHAAVLQVNAAIYFAELAQTETGTSGADPEDSEATLADLRSSGIAAIATGDHDQAAACFLAILARDRKFDDDFGRLALLQLNDLLGADDERVGAIRRRMMTLIY